MMSFSPENSLEITFSFGWRTNINYNFGKFLAEIGFINGHDNKISNNHCHNNDNAIINVKSFIENGISIRFETNQTNPKNRITLTNL